MPRVFLKPTNPKIKVFDPTHKRFLPAEGALVNLNPYFLERIRHGELVKANPDDAPAEIDLVSLKVDELKAMAEKIGLKLKTKNKADIVAEITEFKTMLDTLKTRAAELEIKIAPDATVEEITALVNAAELSALKDKAAELEIKIAPHATMEEISAAIDAKQTEDKGE